MNDPERVNFQPIKIRRTPLPVMYSSSDPRDTGQNSQTVERRKRETKPLSSEHGGGQEPMGREKPAK